MIYHKDFCDLCSLLNESKVDYLIVGAFAVAFHGAPRFTGDLDVLICPEREHVERMLSALDRFGFHTHAVTPEYLLTHGKILQIGRMPVQVHIMTSITGVPWQEAWISRDSGAYGGVPVFFIGKTELLRNKSAAARPKDLADVQALRREDK